MITTKFPFFAAQSVGRVAASPTIAFTSCAVTELRMSLCRCRPCGHSMTMNSNRPRAYTRSPIQLKGKRKMMKLQRVGETKFFSPFHCRPPCSPIPDASAPRSPANSLLHFGSRQRAIATVGGNDTKVIIRGKKNEQNSKSSI